MGGSLVLEGKPKFFTKNIWSQEISYSLVFFDSFRNFLTYLENYPNKSEFSVPIVTMGCKKFHCISSYAETFFRKLPFQI